MSGKYLPPHLKGKPEAEKPAFVRRIGGDEAPKRDAPWSSGSGAPRGRIIPGTVGDAGVDRPARGPVVPWGSSQPPSRVGPNAGGPGYLRNDMEDRSFSSPGVSSRAPIGVPVRQISTPLNRTASAGPTEGPTAARRPIPEIARQPSDELNASPTLAGPPRRYVPNFSSGAPAAPTMERRFERPSPVARPYAPTRDQGAPMPPAYGARGAAPKDDVIKLEPVKFGPPVGSGKASMNMAKFSTSFAELAKEPEAAASESVGPNAVDATQLFEAKAAAFKREQMTATQVDSGVPEELLKPQTIKSITLDASVVLKIVKHCSDHHPSSATGQLLGVDVADMLEITSCYPFTPKSSNDDHHGDDASSKRDSDDTSVQVQMLRCMAHLNMHNNVTGFYQSFPLGDFFQTTFLDTLYNYQKTFPWSVALVYDSTRTNQGALCLKAFQISEEFMKLYPLKKFNIKQLQEHKVVPSKILRQIPITVKNSRLASCFLRQLQGEAITPETALLSKPSASFTAPLSGCDPLIPNLNNLELHADTFLEHQLDYMAECVDDFDNDNRKYQRWQQSLQKEENKVALLVQKRKYENSLRANRGEKPVWTAEQLSLSSPNLQRLYANAPSRLDNLLTINQINVYCNQINQFTGPNVSKLYASKSIQA